MSRWLPAAIALLFVILVVAMATTDAFEGGGQTLVTPTPPIICPAPNCNASPDPEHPPGATPILCPAPNCEGWLETPPPGGYPTPVPRPFVVNGVELPVPPGSASEPPVVDGPADWVYRSPGLASQIAFTKEGWIYGMEIRPEDMDDFRSALDALYQAADPVVINGKSFRVPWGAVYREPFIASWTSGWVGPPEEAPSLHYIKRGNSIISFDDSGTIVAERIAEEDAAEFRPVANAFSASSR